MPTQENENWRMTAHASTFWLILAQTKRTELVAANEDLDLESYRNETKYLSIAITG